MTLNISSGMTRKEVCDLSYIAAIIAKVAKTNPKKILPTSPINIFAGGKFNKRKPIAPARIV
jgi:hypothetical protein